MSRPFMEILKMIEAHYNNDDESFNNYAKAVIDYYDKDGNAEGVLEIKELMKTGHIKPRENTPVFLKEPETNGYVFSSKENIQTEVKTEVVESEDRNIKSEDSTDKPKRHRRTKVQMELDKAKEIDCAKEQEKPKRHRRTKAELEADGYYNKDNKADNQPEPKKRHRRTKAELEAAGYYNN